MSCRHQVPSAAVAEAIEAFGTVWGAYDNVLEPGAQGRRIVRAAALEARRAGARWGQLAKEIGIEPEQLRDFAGCMPRDGRDRSEGTRLGQGSGHPARHRCGCGRDRDHAHGHGCCGGRGHGGGCGGSSHH